MGRQLRLRHGPHTYSLSAATPAHAGIAERRVAVRSVDGPIRAHVQPAARSSGERGREAHEHGMCDQVSELVLLVCAQPFHFLAVRSVSVSAQPTLDLHPPGLPGKGRERHDGL